MLALHHNRSGIILIIAIFAVLITIILSTAYVSRAVLEKSMADREVKRTQALYSSEGGGHAGIKQLDTLINTNLLNTVNAINPATLAAAAANYVSTNNPIGFLVAYTKSGSTALLVKTTGVEEAVYTGSSTTIGTGTYQYTIKITPKGAPSAPAPNVWSFPYYYKIQTTGTNGSENKKYSVYGDFTVQVQKDNFARYALFTNSQTLPSGTKVWFTNTTNFAGPMYTNGSYNFAFNPSGTFYETVKQVGANANFYNNGSTLSLNNDHNGTRDVPVFYNGFTRSATAITMPSTSTEATMITEATAGNSYGSNGIYLPNSGGNLTGGIYVRGNADTVTMSVSGGNAIYTITQSGTTKTITVDPALNQTTLIDSSGTHVYSGQPKGQSNVGILMYVSGTINSIGGTIQKDTQMVVATHNDTIIQNNIVYQEYTPAVGTSGSTGYVPPSAEGYVNLLGIISWAGNIRIGGSAPNNVNVHATMMASSGIVTVDNYNTGSPRGTATVLGGVISNNYGAFGQFDSSSGAAVNGYGRNFVYDTRMETQYTPPYFPTMNTFIAFTNDINDKKFWQKGGF